MTIEQTKFLGTPSCGWAKITLGDFSRSASYMTHVATDCLLSMIHALKHETDFAVSFCTEGNGDFKIISDEYRTYIIEEFDTMKLSVIENINKNDIAAMLLQDIKTNIDAWVQFEVLENDSKEAKLHKRYLIKKLNKLEEWMA